MPAISAAYDIKQALDPAASVFVSANAGAGKTSLLTSRVLRLLLHGVAPSKILCLTFTNAAAAEMTGRILNELGQWVMAQEEVLRGKLQKLTGQVPDEMQLARARSLFATVLEAPDGIRIQTIHGFCQSLLRRFPLEAGIGPHFTVMDTRTQQELLKEARQRLFDRAQRHDPQLRDAISAIARSISESSFQALLEEIVQHNRRFRSLLMPRHAMEQAMADVWRHFSLMPEATLTGLITTHFAYDAQTLAQLRQIAALLLQGDDKAQALGQGMADWLEHTGRRDSRYMSYRQLFLTQKNEPRKNLCNKGVLPEELLEVLKTEQVRVVAFSNACLALEIARRTVQVLHVAEGLLTLYDAQKEARGVLDYDDLIITARKLLQQPGIAPWVLFKLDGGIDHVLVDEAQDTSTEQWQIIDALTQEFFSGLGRKEVDRSLFVVGDEKQSIFSFQGADAAALAHMQHYFSARIKDAALPVYPISLIHSYRSTTQVLNAVDKIFSRPQARSGVIFKEEELVHLITREHPGLVELWPLIEAEEEEGAPSPAARLARTLAETIHGWLKQGMWLEGKNRFLRAGDIMILVRSRTGLVGSLVRALKRRGVPVAGQDRMRLGDNLAVQDLMALGQCLLLPEDDLTLVTVLKNPVFNLSEEQLFTLSWQRGGSVWERLKLYAESDPAFAQAYTLLAELRARADYLTPYALYAYLLDTRGARRRFIGRMGQEYNDPIDEFLGQALVYERGHAPSLQGFLHWLVSGDSEIKRDMEQSQDNVRIMTVHGSKGLQAPVVILPDTVEIPKSKDILLWQEHVFPFWPSTSANDDMLCRQLRQLRKDAELAEYRRLLYVALTRAEDRLYICGATGREKAHEQSWYHLIREGLTPMAVPFDMPWGKGMRVGENSSPHKGEVRKGAVMAPPEQNCLHPSPPPMGEGNFIFLTQPVPTEPAPSQPLSPSRLRGEEPAGASPLGQVQVYQRGTLIHKLLQYLPEMAPEQRTSAARRLALAYAKGWPEEMVQSCMDESLAVIAHPDFDFLFMPPSLAEVPVAGCVSMKGRDIAVSGQIDRLHIGKQDVWIVDYKSNLMPPAQAGDVPVAYLQQMQLYRLLIQRIYPDKSVHCALLWTAAPRLMPLPNALLDEMPVSSYI